MRLFLPLLALPLTLTPAPADWPQFRGPTAEGHADPTADPPAEFGPTTNLAWRREVAGNGWSSPVVAGGRVYLTTAVPQGDGPKADQSLRALALDDKTGAVVWDVEVFKQDGVTAPPIHSKNSHASPTPVIDADRLFVHFGHAGTACLSVKDGSPLWATRELKYRPVHGNGGSPALVGDKLIFSVDGTDRQEVVALDAGTGKVAWRTPREASPGKPFSFGTPLVITVNGRQQLISPGSDVVMSLDPASGKELWRVKYTGYSVVPRPVYANGLVFVCTSYDSPSLVAIRPDGSGDVTRTHVAWTQKKGAPHNPSPLAVGDALYTVADNGQLTCWDARSGKPRWTEGLGGGYSASPLYAGGRVYLLAEDGTATVFKPGAEYEPVGKVKLGERSLASPAADGKALYVRTAKAVYKFEGK